MSSSETRALFCTVAILDILLSDNAGFEIDEFDFTYGSYIGRSGFALYATYAIKDKGILLISFNPFIDEGDFALIDVSVSSKLTYSYIVTQTFENLTSSYYSVSGEDIIDMVAILQKTLQ